MEEEFARLLFGNLTGDFDWRAALGLNVTSDGRWGEGGGGGEGGDRRLIYEQALSTFRETLFAYKQPQTLALLCLYVPVFLAALIGNLLVLLVVLPNRFLRSITNCFIVNLAMADLLVTVVNVPLEISLIIYREWLFGEALCKFTSYLQGVCVAASVFTIMTLSVDRYFAIKRPSTFRKYSTGNNAWKVACVVWSVSAVVMVPLLNVRRLRVVDLFKHHPVYFCVEDWPSAAHRTAYDIFLFIFMVVAPSIFVTLCYSHLFYHLWQQDRRSSLAHIPATDNPSTATPAAPAAAAAAGGGGQCQGQDVPLTFMSKTVVGGGRVATLNARLSPRRSDCRRSLSPTPGGAVRDDLRSGSGATSGGRASTSSGGGREGACRDEPSTQVGGCGGVDSGIGVATRGGCRRSAASRDRDRRSQSNDHHHHHQQAGMSTSNTAADLTLAAKSPVAAQVTQMTAFKQVSQVTKNRRRVAKMLLLLAILFVLCWTPYHIINVYIDFMSTNFNANALVITLLHYAILLGHVNSALNPILYCFLNNSFRQGAARLLHLKRKVRGGRGDRRPVPPDSPQLPPQGGSLIDRQGGFLWFFARNKDKHQQHLRRHGDILR